jgi:hypothetical protein
MDVSRLLKAAAKLGKQNPKVSDELIKISQFIGDSAPPAPVAEQAPAARIPDIKEYANTEAPQEKVTHKISFNVEVPRHWGELEIMNELLPVLKQFEERDPNISIKGYQFSQS